MLNWAHIVTGLAYTHTEGSRRTSSTISDYLDKARLLTRIVHPYMNVHEVLTFGLTYTEQDFDWDTDDDDEGQESIEDADADEESPKAIRYVLVRSLPCAHLNCPCPARVISPPRRNFSTSTRTSSLSFLASRLTSTSWMTTR